MSDEAPDHYSGSLIDDMIALADRIAREAKTRERIEEERSAFEEERKDNCIRISHLWPVAIAS